MRISKVALRGYKISSAWLLLIGVKLQMLESEERKRKEEKNKRNCYDKYVDGHCVYCFSLRNCVHTEADKELSDNLTFTCIDFVGIFKNSFAFDPPLI